MPEASFYHLNSQTLEQVLPPLINKCLDKDWRIVVRFGTKERMDSLNGHLWSYLDDSFIPHGSEEDGYAEHQPVFLTCKDENPNGANVRFLVDRATSTEADFAKFDRTFIIFSDKDGEAKKDARSSWKSLSETDTVLTYWQQDSKGKWERKR